MMMMMMMMMRRRRRRGVNKMAACSTAWNRQSCALPVISESNPPLTSGFSSYKKPIRRKALPCHDVIVAYGDDGKGDGEEDSDDDDNDDDDNDNDLDDDEGQLWGVSREYFGTNWPSFNGIVLCHRWQPHSRCADHWSNCMKWKMSSFAWHLSKSVHSWRDLGTYVCHWTYG